MSDAHLFATGVLLAWLAGVRAYLTVFGVGVAGALGWLDLPPALEATTSPWVLGVSGSLALVEFFTDKIPGVDSGWDLLQTLARVPAGAFLAAAALSPDGELGAGVALTSHAFKAGTRLLLNASPEPFSNVAVSTAEDGVTLGALGLILVSPWLALALVLGAAVLLALALLWVMRRLRRSRRPAGRAPG